MVSFFNKHLKTIMFIVLVQVTVVSVWFGKSISTEAVSFVSPIPSGKAAPTPIDSYLLRVSKSHTTDKFPHSKYFPQNLNIKDSSNDLDISAEAYIAVDRDSKQILLGKNIDKRLPIASLTKIATAVVAIENAPLDLKCTVSSAAANVGEASMGLTASEKISTEEALYGMMLPSGNDAAETLAEGVGKYKLGTPQEDTDGGGARNWFMRSMNQLAERLGMLDTYFFNPTGLDGDSRETTNFSTALDLSALANYALENGVLAKIVDTHEIVLPYKEDFHKAFYLYNILTLEETYKGIRGIKPGISDLAGETLVSYDENEGRRIIAIVLDSQHTKDDIVKIYDKIFGKKSG